MVKLKDNQDVVLQFCIARNNTSHIPSELINKGLQAQIKNNLRYNPKTGKTYSNDFKNTCVAEYVETKDIPKYEDTETCACWEFAGFVRNSASRLQRGYSAI